MAQRNHSGLLRDNSDGGNKKSAVSKTHGGKVWGGNTQWVRLLISLAPSRCKCSFCTTTRAIIEFSTWPTDTFCVLQVSKLDATRFCDDVSDLRLACSSNREHRVPAIRTRPSALARSATAFHKPGRCTRDADATGGQLGLLDSCVRASVHHGTTHQCCVSTSLHRVMVDQRRRQCHHSSRND
jgi:hypothetical protein